MKWVLYSVIASSLFVSAAQATPLYPDRVAPSMRMVDGDVKPVYPGTIPSPAQLAPPRPRGSIPLPPPRQFVRPTQRVAPVVQPVAPVVQAAQPANPFQNAPFQIKPLSDYPMLKQKKGK